MRLLANENVPLASVRILTESGHDVVVIGQDLAGITNKEVIDIAVKQERTIITFDRDYGELIFKKGLRPKSGVIYLRWFEFLPEEPGEYLVQLFFTGDLVFENKLTVISESDMRQRSY